MLLWAKWLWAQGVEWLEWAGEQELAGGRLVLAQVAVGPWRGWRQVGIGQRQGTLVGGDVSGVQIWQGGAKCEQSQVFWGLAECL